jgi:hypothetical protein
MKADEWWVRHLAEYVKIPRPTNIGNRLRWKAGAAVVPDFLFQKPSPRKKA